MSGAVADTLFVVSVIVFCVNFADSAVRTCPGGQVKPVGDTDEMSNTTEPLTRPFLSAVSSVSWVIGVVIVILLSAFGGFWPLLTQPNVAVTTEDISYLTSGLPIPTSTHVYNRSGRAADPVDVGFATAAAVAVVVVPPVVVTENDLKCGKFAAPAGNNPTALAATTAITDNAKRPVRLRVCFDMFPPAPAIVTKFPTV